MTVRGLRGATTVKQDREAQVLQATATLVEEMVTANQIPVEDIVSVLISTTADIQSTFPAKAVRTIDGWKYVPVMCTHEMNVPGAMPLCIRVLMQVNSTLTQQEVVHIYQNDAVQLRPDLQQGE